MLPSKISPTKRINYKSQITNHKSQITNSNFQIPTSKSQIPAYSLKLKTFLLPLISAGLICSNTVFRKVLVLIVLDLSKLWYLKQGFLESIRSLCKSVQDIASFLIAR